MAKRPKRLALPEENVPDHIRKAKPQGRGTSDSVVDAGFWLDNDGITDWITAIEAYDKRADKKPLLALLDSERELPRQARIFLADLLKRQLKKKPGTTLPAYDRTDLMVKLLAAKDDIAKLVRRGVSGKVALEQVSAARGISIESLALVRAGRHGGINRIKKRRP
jgi:hypothetical protein